MQLNSISVMDLVAFGGSAIGIIIGISEFNNGSISLLNMLIIILLSAEFLYLSDSSAHFSTLL